jgi:hypothetical protein
MRDAKGKTLFDNFWALWFFSPDHPGTMSALETRITLDEALDTLGGSPSARDYLSKIALHEGCAHTKM